MNIPGAFQKVDINHDSVTEMALALQSVAGFATLSYGPLPKGSATPTNLANDATTYTADVLVNDVPGAAGTTVNVSVVGSAAQTFATLITELNTDLGGNATATLVGGDIIITSATTGKTSNVTVTDTTDGTALVGLFAAVKGVNYGLFSNQSVKGHVEYMNWDELAHEEKVEVATIVGAIDTTDIQWTFATDSVRVTGTGITPLSTVGIVAGTYRLSVDFEAPFTATDIAFVVSAGMTFQQLLDDAFLPALKAHNSAANAYWSQVNSTTLDLIVETGTVGAGGSVAVVAGTSTDLIAAVEATSAWTCAVGAAVAGVDGTTTIDTTGASAGIQDVTVTDSPAVTGATASGLAADTYSITASVDGAAAAVVPVVIAGTEDLDAVAAAIDSALAGATVAFVTSPSAAFRFTSGSTGASSAVLISAGTGADPDLFAALAASLTATVAFGTPVPGLADASWKNRLELVKSLNGFPITGQVGTTPIVETENKPQAKGKSFNGGEYKYHDGAAWRDYDTDATV